MRKIIFCGDSYSVAAFTDYEWLIKQNLIDIKNIRGIDFFNNLKNFNNKNNSFFKISEKIKKENSWANRLANLLNIDYLNLGAPGQSWQGIYNQIIYAIYKWHETDDLLFLISCPINERIISSNERIMGSSKKDPNFDYFNFYDFEKDSVGDFLLNNSCYFRKNKLNFIVDFFSKEENELLEETFDKKIFKIMNFQSIVSIINTLKNYNIKFFFLPAWYETVESQIEELNVNKKLLNSLIISKISKEELSLKSPMLLKNFKDIGFSPHPSFDSQKIIAEYYYDFLKKKIK